MHATPQKTSKEAERLAMKVGEQEEEEEEEEISPRE